MNTLKVNNKELQIIQVYPYQYNYGEGKTVLRIRVSKDAHGYAELEQEFSNVTTDIEHYEDAILVNKYTGYNRDFKCNYANNEFEVEVTQITQTELELVALRTKQAQDNLETQLAIAELTNTLLGGTI